MVTFTGSAVTGRKLRTHPNIVTNSIPFTMEADSLIYNKFKNTLTQKGLKEVEVEHGDAFDAEIHEAISQIPAPDKKLKGKIIDVVEKGYKLGDLIIRYPKVVMGS